MIVEKSEMERLPGCDEIEDILGNLVIAIGQMHGELDTAGLLMNLVNQDVAVADSWERLHKAYSDLKNSLEVSDYFTSRLIDR